jgi:hypothetical protein
MNNEFKKINNNNITRYVLEDGSSGGATSGGTSAGSIAGFAKPMGGIQRRAGDDLINQENKKSYKISHKPRNPVAKAHQTVGTGSGTHTDKTKVIPRKEKHKKTADMTLENFNAEYDDEAGMSYDSLHTINRAATGLLDTIKQGDDLPEWCQEKISLAEDYLITVWDYLQSEKEQGVAEGEEYQQYKVEMIDRNGKMNGIYHKDNTHYNLENMLSDIKGYQRNNPQHTFKLYINDKPVDWKELASKQGVAEDTYLESLNAKLAEKLDPNAEPEVWVQDFQKANPNKYHQFKNKTPQKKAQMAVAARRDARLSK